MLNPTRVYRQVMGHCKVTSTGSNDLDHLMIPCMREIVEFLAPLQTELSSPATYQQLSYRLERMMVELDMIFLAHGNAGRLFIKRPSVDMTSEHSITQFFSDRGNSVVKPDAVDTRILSKTRKSVSSIHLMEWLRTVNVEKVYLLNYGGKIPLYLRIEEGDSDVLEPGIYWSKTVHNLDKHVQTTGERHLDIGLTVRTKKVYLTDEPAINLIIPPCIGDREPCSHPNSPDVFPLFHHFPQLKDIPITPGGFTITGNRLDKVNSKTARLGVTTTKITGYTGTYGTLAKQLAPKDDLAKDISWSVIGVFRGLGV